MSTTRGDIFRALDELGGKATRQEIEAAMLRACGVRDPKQIPPSRFDAVYSALDALETAKDYPDSVQPGDPKPGATATLDSNKIWNKYKSARHWGVNTLSKDIKPTHNDGD
jgi:hypothetical protein